MKKTTILFVVVLLCTAMSAPAEWLMHKVAGEKDSFSQLYYNRTAKAQTQSDQPQYVYVSDVVVRQDSPIPEPTFSSVIGQAVAEPIAKQATQSFVPASYGGNRFVPAGVSREPSSLPGLSLDQSQADFQAEVVEFKACDVNAKLVQLVDFQPDKDRQWVNFNWMTQQLRRQNPKLNPNLIAQLYQSNSGVVVKNRETGEYKSVAFQSLQGQPWERLVLEFDPCTEIISGMYKEHRLKNPGQGLRRKLLMAATTAAIPAAWIFGGPAVGIAASGAMSFAR